MTEASLCKKSYFGAYLRYRLGRMKSLLIVGLIINLTVLPLQGLLMIIRTNRLANPDGVSNYTAMVYVTMFGAFAAIIGLAFTMICAAISYSFFCTKESVDTLGVLAMTYKQRFWGDFLSGFIPCAGMFIPSALIGILFTAIAQNKLATVTIDEKHVNIMPYFMGITLTLFFAYLFVYLLATLAAMCCGRSSSMVVFSVISFAAIPILGISISKFITLEAIGISDEIVNRVQGLCMPAGLFFSPAIQATGMMFNEYNQKMLLNLSELEFAVLSPVSIVILIIAAVVILALAYFAGKNRKQENVGRMFVQTGYLQVITIVMSAGGFFVAACMLRGRNPALIIPIGLVVSLVIAVIFEVIRRPRVRQIPKAAIRWAATAACSVGLMFLISKTGAFGLINIPKDVKSMRIEFYDNNFTIRELELTSPEEIAEFLEVHNKSINKWSKYICDSNGHGFGGFNVSYITAGGDEVIRGYSVNNYGYNHGFSIEDTLSKNVLELSFYSQKFAELSEGKAVSAEIAVSEIFSKVYVPTERLEEFMQTLRQDIIDHYDANADSIGSAEVALEDSSVPYSIQSGYENTLRLVREYNSSVEKDPDAVMMTIACDLNRKVGTDDVYYYKTYLDLDLIIRERDMEKPKVKELLDLFDANADSNTYYDLTSIYGHGSNGIVYNIPNGEKNHAAKLIAQIAAESVQ